MSGAAAADTATNVLPAVDTSALTAPARAASPTSPVVSVPTDASWDFASPDLSVAANPKPKVVAVARTAQVSRSTVRTEVAPVSSPVPQSVAGNAVLEIASRYVGIFYVYGGTHRAASTAPASPRTSTPSSASPFRAPPRSSATPDRSSRVPMPFPGT